jgi:uncharacterized protein (DUF169 family)
MELSDYRQAGLKLYEKLHLATYPVAIKFIKDEKEISRAFFRPKMKHQKLSLCQAITMARRWGMPVAMTAEDNFCTPAMFAHGWEEVDKEDLLESQLFQKWHKDRDAEIRRLEHQIGLMSKEARKIASRHRGMLCARLQDSSFIPDTVLTFGNAENITHVIQALTYNGENYPLSSFEGFGETCVKGALYPYVAGIPQVVIPGMGDRGFGGSNDYEIAVGVAAKLVFEIADNLFLTGGPLNMGQPVKAMIPMGLTESLTPGFKFLRKRIDEKKHK